MITEKKKSIFTITFFNFVYHSWMRIDLAKKLENDISHVQTKFEYLCKISLVNCPCPMCMTIKCWHRKIVQIIKWYYCICSHVHCRHDTCGVKDIQYRSTYILSVDYYNVSPLIAIIYCNNGYIYSILQVSSVSGQKQIGSLFMDVYPIINCVTLQYMHICIVKSTNPIVDQICVENYSEVYIISYTRHRYL